MGLFGFMKKGGENKGQKELMPQMQEFELPPPPKIESFSSDLPVFSGASTSPTTLQPLAPLDSSTSANMPKPAPFPELDSLPEIKPFNYNSYEQQAIPAPLQQQPFQPDIPKTAPVPQWAAAPITPIKETDMKEMTRITEFTPKLAEESKEPAAHAEEKKYEEPHIFIKDYKFRQIVEDLDEIAGYNQAGPDFERIRNSSESEYEKLSICLEDMQRGMMFMDKTLFEV